MLRVYLILIMILFVSCQESESPDTCSAEDKTIILQKCFPDYCLWSENGIIFSLYHKYKSTVNDSAYEEIKTSSDNGYSWHSICKIRPGIIDVFNSRWVFSVAQDSSFWLTNNGYLYKSTDKGISWVKQNDPEGSTGDETEFELFEPDWNHINKKGIIYLFNKNKGIFRSKDNGENWDFIVKDLNNAFEFVEIFDDKIFYYTKGNNLMVSMDDGDSWTKVNGISMQDMTYFNERSAAIQGSYFDMIEGDKSNLFFRIFPFSDYEFILFKSTDNGVNWTKIISGVNKSKIKNIILIGVNVHEELYALGYKSDATSSYYDTGIYKSYDYGLTWKYYLDIPWNHLVITEDHYLLFVDCDANLRITKEKLF